MSAEIEVKLCGDVDVYIFCSECHTELIVTRVVEDKVWVEPCSSCMVDMAAEVVEKIERMVEENGKESALSQLASRLRKFNEWRRCEDIPQPSPAIIGRDIDMAIECIEKLERMMKK